MIASGSAITRSANNIITVSDLVVGSIDLVVGSAVGAGSA